MESMPSSSESTPPAPQLYTCPECGQETEATPTPAAQFIACSRCNAQFVIAGTMTEDTEDSERAPKLRRPLAGDDDLDGVRIKQLSAMKRAANRTCSYYIVGTVGCFAGVGQLIFLTICDVRNQHAWKNKPTAYLLAAAALVLAGLYFLRRAREYWREAQQHLLSEPTTPPDLDALSDGSQRWKNLDSMTPPEEKHE